MRISDWSSDVCSSDLLHELRALLARRICERHSHVRIECRTVLGRLSAPFRLGAALLNPGHHLAVRQEILFLFCFLMVEGDCPVLRLCQTDAAWLESFFPTFVFLGVPGVGLPHAAQLWRRTLT